MLKTRNQYTQPFSSRHRGGSLIEVLVAVLLVSVALVGLAALQAQSLRNVNSTVQRSTALNLMTSVTDYIKTHYQPYATGRPANYASTFNWSVYNFPMTCIGATIPTSSLIGGWLNQHVTNYVTPTPDWIIKGFAPLPNPLAGMCLHVNCAAGQCTVTVQWNDSRGSAGSSTQQLVETFRLVP